MSPNFIKTIDRIAGPVLVSLFGRTKKFHEGAVRSMLLIRPGGIGDAVLLASVIRCIGQVFPTVKISILAERRNAGVFPLIPGVHEVFCYDRPREFMSIMSRRFDVVIDTEQWYRLSAVVARLVRAPMKIGFSSNERRRMFTHGVQYDLAAYEPDNFASLLTPLGVDCQSDAGNVSLKVPLQAMSKAEQLLQPLSSETFIAIFPGASVPVKRWGGDHFRRVAEVLSSFGVKVIVVGGKEDHSEGEIITCGGMGLNFAGITSLAETAAVIKRSALLLSGDSGVLHIAAGLGVPTVSLFGPGNVSKWAPQGERHIIINKVLPCSPCSSFGTIPPCPNNNRCLNDIAVDEVVNAVTMLLTSMGAMPSRCCKQNWIETNR